MVLWYSAMPFAIPRYFDMTLAKTLFLTYLLAVLLLYWVSVWQFVEILQKLSHCHIIGSCGGHSTDLEPAVGTKHK